MIQILTNPQANAILLTSVPATLYVLAAYGHLFLKGASMTMSIIVAIMFASVEYIFRVPIVKYSHEVAGMSNTYMQVVWVILTSLLSWASDFMF